MAEYSTHERTGLDEVGGVGLKATHDERFQQASSFAHAAVELIPGLSGTLSCQWSDYILGNVLDGRLVEIDWLALQRLDSPPARQHSSW
jgi:hypothetical protein